MVGWLINKRSCAYLQGAVVAGIVLLDVFTQALAIALWFTLVPKYIPMVQALIIYK